MEENQINVLYVEPKKAPVAAEIGKELESYQEAVGGMIEVIYPFDDMVCIVCNEEGKPHTAAVGLLFYTFGSV